MHPSDRALELAASAIGLTEPNPRVGCVITSADGRRVLGEGHTQQAGGPHAEVMALRAAQAAGHDVRGATAWVTLEPGAHHGRTPPCCDALIGAGIGRVVAALEDPFPQVAGQGLARLRAAGVEVQLAGRYDPGFAGDPACHHPGDPQGLAWATAARELNIGFLSRVVRGRPWVRMKIAASLDGTTALADGQSQWITAPDARADGHAWRRRASAVLTGIGTVREDDPRLDVRLVPTPGQPRRVVIDSRLEIDAGARILQPPGEVLLYCAQDHAGSARASSLRAAAPNLSIVAAPADAKGKTDLLAVIEDLAARGVNELHVEAGHRLNGSLLRAGLVDELLVYLAPKLLGSGRGMAEIGPLQDLAQATEMAFIDVAPVGRDLRLRARPPGRERF
ncbi:MAG: bifunctional diaminohydroxyphosphoribosylaminopyrimidine deaminase/5-amino-6-(5-phosphoribosylamino)uracil reductase RibD [Rubrivivax sp.]